MKKLLPVIIIAVFILLPLASKTCNALGLTVNGHFLSPSDKSLSSTPGLEAQIKWTHAYLYITSDYTKKHLVGQTGATYITNGIGFGYSVPIWVLSLSCQVGYYVPIVTSTNKEGIYREMHRLSDPVDGWTPKPGVPCCEGYVLDYDYQSAKYEVGDNFGGNIRLALNKSLAKHLKFNVFVGYKVLRLPTKISADIIGLPQRPDGKQAYHIFHGSDELSGLEMGVEITLKW